MGDSERFVITNPDLLRALRKGRGLTVAQLAAVLHVSKVTVRNWETGAHGRERGIYAHNAKKLLHVLRQDPHHAEHLGRWVNGPT